MTWDRIEAAAWIACLLGVIGAAIGWALSPGAFGEAWLSALLILFAWCVGATGLIFVHALTGGAWGSLARPHLALGALASPLMLPAIVPLLLLAYPVYAWSHPDVAQHLGNARYLNLPFFWGRVSGGIVLWAVLGLLAAVATLRPFRIAAWVAGPALVLLFFFVTVLAVDTVLSREPHYNSTAFGMIIAAEFALFALALAGSNAALLALADSAALAALAKVLLLLVVLWGYLVFVQFLIVWSSDLGADAPWYVARAQHGWGIVAGIVFALHFVLPLCVLTAMSASRPRHALLIAGPAIAFSEIPRAWWLVLPSSGSGVGWIDGVSMLVMLGLLVGLHVRLPALLHRGKPVPDAVHA